MKNYVRSSLMCISMASALSACLALAQTQIQGSNPSVKVELLFEADGCKVYRFYDRGNARYFTKCQNGSSSVGWLESCGKNCVYYAENGASYPKDGISVKQ